MKKISDETFFWSIKLVCIGALVILALGLAFSAHAATPVAVWDGDFTTTTKGGYTLDANGNTVAEDGSTITINQSKGVTVNASAMSNGMTVMFRYSDLTLGSQQTVATSCVNSDKTGDRTGVYLDANNKSHGIWNTTSTYDTSVTTQGTMTDSQLSGTLVLTYKHDSGTYLYRVADGAATCIHGNSTLKASGDTSIYGCAVGGTRAGNFAAATGLKISAIAVFNSVLTEDEMKSYKWPSEQPYNSVVSVNFGANTSARTVSGDPGAVVDDSNWYNRSAYNESNVTIGTAKLAHTSSGIYNNDSQSKSYNKGYLDDYANGTTPVTVTVSSLANGYYDLVIYCSSDNATRFSYKTVNNVDYTYDSATGKAKVGTASWGSNATSSTEPGNHALLIEDVKVTNGSIAISSLRKDEGETRVRGSISAIQFCNKKVYSATISDSKTFGDISWEQGSLVSAAGTTAIVTVDGAASAGEVDISFNDPTITLKTLKLVGSRDVRLVATSALSNIASIDRTGLTGKLTYAWPVSALPMTDANVYYGAGAGSEEKHASISIAENMYLNLRGTTPFYLGTTAGESVTPYAMTFTDATVHCLGWSGLAVGQATVTVEGSSTVSTERVILSQGMNGLTSALVVKGTASVTSTGMTDEDSNKNSVMFGHWNGPSTFTLQDSATFTSASQVLVGKTGNNQTINIAGGTFTAKGIKTSDNASGSNTINLSGGKLVLGEVGITSYSSSRTISVNVTGNATIDASANMAITQPVSLGNGKALTLTAPANLAMTASGVISGAGSIVKDGAGQVVLSGVNTFTGGTTINAGVLVLGNNSALGTGTVTIGENGELDLNGKTVTISSFAGSGTICNSSGTLASINGVPVKTGDELNLKDGKIKIVLGASETLTLTALPPNDTVTIGGTGTVEYSNATPPTLPTGLWAEGWTGTFKYAGLNADKTAWDIRSYYNGTLSKFEFAGTMTGGYFYDGPFSVGELVLSGSIKLTDGYTSTGGSVNNYVFAKLSGGGTFEIATTTTASPGVKFCDVSGFTGTIKNTGKDGSGYRVMLGDGDLLAVGDYPTKAAIHFTGNATLQAMTLQAENGVKTTDDVSLVFADAGSKLTVNSSVTVAEDVTIPVTIADTKGLTAGTALITWTGTAPSGNFSLEAGSGAAKGTSGFKASKNMSNLTAIADTSKTYYEIGDGESGGTTTTTFDNTWLTDAGVKGATTEATQENLNGKNDNGIKMSDVYLMGYAATEAKNAAVILRPNQAQSNGETISLSVAGVPNETRNGAVVTYTALASASRDWEHPSVEEEMGATLSVSMALPDSGVLYYRVQAEVALP